MGSVKLQHLVMLIVVHAHADGVTVPPSALSAITSTGHQQDIIAGGNLVRGS